jgi:hypothetical protein
MGVALTYEIFAKPALGAKKCSNESTQLRYKFERHEFTSRKIFQHTPQQKTNKSRENSKPTFSKKADLRTRFTTFVYIVYDNAGVR